MLRYSVYAADVCAAARAPLDLVEGVVARHDADVVAQRRRRFLLRVELLRQPLHHDPVVLPQVRLQRGIHGTQHTGTQEFKESNPKSLCATDLTQTVVF